MKRSNEALTESPVHVLGPVRRLVTLAALAMLVAATACTPKPGGICDHLGELHRSDDAWDGDACVAEMERFQDALGDDWKDIAVCFRRASNSQSVGVCRDAANTLLVVDLCEHVAEVTERTPQDSRTPCYREMRELRHRAGDGWSDAEACMMAAGDEAGIDACREQIVLAEDIEEPVEEEPESDEPGAAVED